MGVQNSRQRESLNKVISYCTHTFLCTLNKEHKNRFSLGAEQHKTSCIMYIYNIQFEYGADKVYRYTRARSCDLSQGTPNDKLYVVEMIEEIIAEEGLHEDEHFVHDVILSDEAGNPLWGIVDLSILYRN